MLNEYEEIVAQTFVSSTSHAQIQQNIEDFVATKKKLKHPPIKYVYIDSCCQDRDVYETVI